ncbi:CheR family methyltransferase [Pseudosulfitobacter koreensis]|uniref:PAS domain-containing protein n=1 Tax=Pseudosulfitobacter koreensis TaxID=2968472 RepID=A0ABT1Z0L8_9RHOB|nr:CheR family methyltransferase [Pseudosulfitobacter koreense]MCR8826682.1 PAS domain-containing protein [Pseudosulfitobacter koreense]
MNDDQPLIVGIGASAGGINAITELLEAIPPRCGMGFVIVTHLNPDRESLLHSVLSQKTEMTVKVARDGDKVEADTVYVMPERCYLTIRNGALKLVKSAPGVREHKPIDTFFSALAEDQTDNAAAIVLSGGDGDGTLGVKVIKEHGGVTFAQTADGGGPLNSEMPESAIAAGFVDFAIPAGEMPEKLAEIRDSRAKLDALVIAKDMDPNDNPPQVQKSICDILQNETGHDFSGYKSKTFFRRVARRMQVRQISDLEGYCALLKQESEEVTSLFRDLLISVTNFFRDTEAFAALAEQVIPKLCENRDAKNPVRIWVPACTTGEEVYSLAILITEHLEANSITSPVQIFATDIDESALAIARQGRYPEQLVRDVSPERLERFFHQDGVSYVVCKKVREMCIFSPHNVISDPPFSRMDMVSCRNLLIYFGPELQRQVIPTFHYALKVDGYLFLGTSESISQFHDLFSIVDKKHRIFQARDHGNRRWSPMSLNQRVTDRSVGTDMQDRLTDIQMRHRIERHILENHTPPHAVVGQDGEIVFVSGGTSSVLELPRGAPSRNLLDMVRRELRIELRNALREVAETHRAVTRRNLPMTTATGDGQIMNITVEPLRWSTERSALFIVFFQLGEEPAATASPASAEGKRASEAVEHELREMRERLQSTVEEYETALEELKSSNEELVSVNEEAQSSNEELEATKEEMQSLNEELNTINAELKTNIEDLDRANADLRNLFDATQIATVFLDGELVIRTFTPAAAELFNLRNADVGRPLPELASVSDYPELREHIREVFSSGEVYEHRLSRSEHKSHYLVRITPYLGENQEVEGAIVTLVDVTSLVESEEQQRILIAELNHRVKNMLAVIVTIVKTSLRGKGVEADVLETLINRLQGMARAYGLLSERSWTTVGMRDIVNGELSIFEADRFHVSGPNVNLDPSQSLSISMVIHELVTNAVKYGALSNHDGTLEIRWTVAKGVLELDWKERDGPQIDAPDQNGFGYVLVEGQIEQQLGGKLDAEFARDGLVLKMQFPL